MGRFEKNRFLKNCSKILKYQKRKLSQKQWDRSNSSPLYKTIKSSKSRRISEECINGFQSCKYALTEYVCYCTSTTLVPQRTRSIPNSITQLYPTVGIIMKNS